MAQKAWCCHSTGRGCRPAAGGCGTTAPPALKLRRRLCALALASVARWVDRIFSTEPVAEPEELALLASVPGYGVLDCGATSPLTGADQGGRLRGCSSLSRSLLAIAPSSIGGSVCRHIRRRSCIREYRLANANCANARNLDNRCHPQEGAALELFQGVGNYASSCRLGRGTIVVPCLSDQPMPLVRARAGHFLLPLLNFEGKHVPQFLPTDSSVQS